MALKRGIGRKVVSSAGTAEALGADISGGGKEIIITAETDNTGYIVVGDSTVIASLSTRIGTPLSAGQSFVTLMENLSELYIDSTVNGDGVTYHWVDKA